MMYNIKITDSHTELAQSLLYYLKSLANSPEYSFLEIQQMKDDELSTEVIEELEFRLEHYQDNKQNLAHRYL